MPTQVLPNQTISAPNGTGVPYLVLDFDKPLYSVGDLDTQLAAMGLTESHCHGRTDCQL